MSNEAPPKKNEGGGAPAWVMTFADLMSLLMCFFVLLLSFAEMDLLKFKQISGSMKLAFGVQREIKASEMPKGTSVIAREFSPGKPTPTLVTEVRQQTIDETKQTLEFTDATTEKDDENTAEQMNDVEDAPIQKKQDSETPNDDQMEYQLKTLKVIVEELKQDVSELSEQLEDKMSEEEKQAMDEAEEKLASIEEKIEEIIQLQSEIEPEKIYITEEVVEKTQEDTEKLLQALAPEIKEGLVSIETEDNKILLRIKEKGSFPSGSATMKGGFFPVINKLKVALKDIDGKVIVSGHTDNIPIKTKRFRSNWELSSSRAVTVVHELLNKSQLDIERFTVEGLGSAYPIVPNDSSENRALNRRVELTIIQGENDQIDEKSAEEELQQEVSEDKIISAEENEIIGADKIIITKDEIQIPAPEEKNAQENEIIDTVDLKTRIQSISGSLTN